MASSTRDDKARVAAACIDRFLKNPNLIHLEAAYDASKDALAAGATSDDVHKHRTANPRG